MTRDKTKKTEKEKPGKKVEAGLNPWNILLWPHLAEKSMNLVELENKLVFIVDRRANKRKIKEAVEKGFAVKVVNVRTVITRTGLKKAYVKLSPENLAVDIASRLGML